jgi:hypothetical protein
MNQVTLQFPSILELIEFSLIINGTMFEADSHKNTLSGELSIVDVQLAKTNYKASVIAITNPYLN